MRYKRFTKSENAQMRVTAQVAVGPYALCHGVHPKWRLVRLSGIQEEDTHAITTPDKMAPL
jgi:hypothetical protein